MTTTRILIATLLTATFIPLGSIHAQEYGRGDLLQGRFWTGPEVVKVEGAVEVGEGRNSERDERPERPQVRTEAGVRIDKRIELIDRLEMRIQNLKHMPDETKEKMQVRLDAHAANLADLKARIEAGTSTATLRGMVALPQVALSAASERILTITGQMDVFGAKLDARIEAAADAGATVTEAEAAYDRYLKAVADAKAEARAAANLTADLSTDGSSSSVKANVAVLAEARGHIRAAHELLKEARKEIGVILSSLKGEVKVEAEVS